MKLKTVESSNSNNKAFFLFTSAYLSDKCCVRNAMQKTRGTCARWRSDWVRTLQQKKQPQIISLKICLLMMQKLSEEGNWKELHFVIQLGQIIGQKIGIPFGFLYIKFDILLHGLYTSGLKLLSWMEIKEVLQLWVERFFII